MFPFESCNSVSKGSFREFRPFSVIAENHWPYTSKVCEFFRESVCVREKEREKNRKQTLLNKKARPVAPVNRVEISSERLVKMVSQLAHEKRRVPPMWSRKIRPMVLWYWSRACVTGRGAVFLKGDGLEERSETPPGGKSSDTSGSQHPFIY